MLRITTEKKRYDVVLTVEGRLSGQTVPRLEQCWRELRAASPGEKFGINLCGVTFIDAAGKALLKEIHGQGGRLTADGCLNEAIIKDITGSRSESKREPSKRSHIIFYVAFFSLLLTPALTRAQDAGNQTSLPPNPPPGIFPLTLTPPVTPH